MHSTLKILILAQMGWFSKNVQKFSHAVFLINAFDKASQSHPPSAAQTARFRTVLSCPISIDFKSNKIVNAPAHSVQ